MIDEAARWRRMAALLPPAGAGEVADCWDIGEQEAGLDRLVAGLLEHRVEIGGDDRAEIAVAAEAWGVRAALTPALLSCAGRHDPGGRLQLVEPPEPSPLPGPALAMDPELADLLVILWIACTRCGQVLARAHRREPWGGLSLEPVHYVLAHPGRRNKPTRLFGPDGVWEAWESLRAYCA